ncbi:MAG: hypothetical protein BGO14_09290 [Chlamydiales bacterium 38-26]|nr:hypothetical protein [Chlamydiales bacterium]OJV11171.1 MAG: hypothetical protein BGO14_09290 [Chlamydiales bacterium 38-26]
MEIPVTFSKGRIYFGAFNEDNDIDPKTQRSGVNYFRFNLIGRILHFLGLADKIHYTEGKQKGIVYLNSKSFFAWKERHKQDEGLPVESLNQAFSQKKFEKAVALICVNFVKHKANHQKSFEELKETPSSSQEETETNSPLQEDTLSNSNEKSKSNVQNSSDDLNQPLEIMANPETPPSALLPKTKEEIFIQLGLNYNPPQPILSTPLRNSEELEKDLSIYNSEVCLSVNSNKISQKHVLDLIKKIHNKLLYVSFESFKEDLKGLTQQLLNTTNGQPYFVGTASGKSNTWVAEHALQSLDLKDLPEGTFELALYESTETLPDFKQAIEKGIKKFVIFDDIIYTGSQMKSHIGRILRTFNQFKNDDLELTLVVPYVSEQFKTSCLKNSNKFKLLTTQTTVPSLTDALSRSEIELLRLYYPNSFNQGYLTYADWKVADVKSVPEFLHHGVRLKEGIFRFMRNAEPLYPPYKKREELNLIYEISSHPFDNNQTVDFEN